MKFYYQWNFYPTGDAIPDHLRRERANTGRYITSHRPRVCTVCGNHIPPTAEHVIENTASITRAHITCVDIRETN